MDQAGVHESNGYPVSLWKASSFRENSTSPPLARSSKGSVNFDRRIRANPSTRWPSCATTVTHRFRTRHNRYGNYGRAESLPALLLYRPGRESRGNATRLETRFGKRTASLLSPPPAPIRFEPVTNLLDGNKYEGSCAFEAVYNVWCKRCTYYTYSSCKWFHEICCYWLADGVRSSPRAHALGIIAFSF